jgi:transcriptional regulator GlxA family with amidase domain
MVDAFQIANLWHQAFSKEECEPLFETRIVTEDGRAVNAWGGITVNCDGSIDEVGDTDAIIIPPFLPVNGSLMEKFRPLLDWVVVHYRKNTMVCAQCTGSFLLAETGLLDGKMATTNWHFVRSFKRRYPKVRLEPERVLTEDSGLFCSGAATASLNLALRLIEIFGTETLASVCAKALLVDPNRESQSPYVIYDFQKNHNDMEILKAQAWMETNYSGDVGIDSIANRVGISPRHFKRRFKRATGESPLSYLQQLRVEEAKKRLEKTRDTVNEITWGIGYEDSSTFRRLFKKFTGLTPREYRDKFSRPVVH